MDWGTLWTAASVLVAAVGLAAGLISRRLSHITKQNAQQLKLQGEQRQREDEFRRDWYGEPARPGVAAEPGVMERLQRIEHNTSTLPDRVSELEKAMVESQADRRALNQRLDDHLHTHQTPST